MAAVGRWSISHGVYQAEGKTEWHWSAGGEGDEYWAYSVRPKQLNMLVEVERQWTTSDNNYNFDEHFVVRVAPNDRGENGGLLMFNVIRVT